MSSRVPKTLAILYGLIVALALVLVNVLPRTPFDTSGYRHGWPLVYMTRESRIPGPFTVYAGPWPFFKSSLETFEPGYLSVDCVVALALIVASMFALHRLLILEPYPVQPRISLWQILCGMALFGVGLGVLREDLIYFLLFRLPILLVYWSLVVIFLACVDRRVKSH